ncbi:MAG: hypothetical protein EXS15_01300 [Phycisphaerales bacterium]|nr:hypothetical protein [Phycisphaerales bacterium]
MEVAQSSAAELRLSLSESAQSSCLEIASSDHPMALQFPAEVARIERAQIPTLIEAIAHKLHLTQVYVIPIGHWRQLFEAVAEGMATNEKWLEIDNAATVELNTRDALLFLPANHHIMRDLISAVLTTGTSAQHGLSIATPGSPLLIEVIPAGEVSVYTGRTNLADLVREHLQLSHGASKHPPATMTHPAPTTKQS